MTARPVTLCLINFDGVQCLPQALDAAQAHAQFAEILVVDNASTDGSVALLQSRYPHVRIVQLDSNRGPAAARNAALVAARCDLILFQDNDVQLTPGCVGYLLAALQRSPRALLVAPRVLYGHDPDIVQYDSADCHVLGLMITRNANRRAALTADEPASTTSLVTACFLLDRARWHSPTLFDERFGFNYEDHDFGVRACVSGYELLVEPHAQVLHAGGTPGLSFRPGGTVYAPRVYYLIRNRWYVLTKVFARRTLVVLAPVLLLYEVNQFIGALYKGWRRSWWAAARDYWRELPRLLRDRSAVQASRRVGDRSLLKSGPLPLTVAVSSTAAERIAVGALQAIVNVYWRMVRPLI
ncbi:MAG TPA: glycosyltransferase [Steroidobacteraceae bacterium]|jgi:hypothetical protein|nr:glycosyltransferase [Steroidobacteraceae bacterium]